MELGVTRNARSHGSEHSGGRPGRPPHGKAWGSSLAPGGDVSAEENSRVRPAGTEYAASAPQAAEPVPEKSNRSSEPQEIEQYQSSLVTRGSPLWKNVTVQDEAVYKVDREGSHTGRTLVQKRKNSTSAYRGWKSRRIIGKYSMVSHILGIDISKEKFDVVLIALSAPEQGAGRHQVFSNAPKGFADLARWLKKQKVNSLHACMEATGNYGDALAFFLHEQGYPVSIVNPFQIKSYANSELQRSSTDHTSSAVIARFCRSHQPPLWQPPSQEMRELIALVRRLEELEVAQTRVKNQRQTPGLPEAVQLSLTRQQAFLREETQGIQQQVRSLIQQHPDLQKKVRLLRTIPGIGEATATKLLAQLGEVTRFDNTRQAAAYAGLVPSRHTSGSSVRSKPRLSKKGNPRLRKTLYFPALTASKHNPVLKKVYQRLMAAHRPKMVAVGAVMHKLVKMAVAILRNQTPFNPNHSFSQS